MNALPKKEALEKEKLEEPKVPAPHAVTIHSSEFDNDQLQASWQKYREMKLKEDPTDGLRMVLSREISKCGESEVEIALSAEIEKKFLQIVEMELVQFLRRDLLNEKISLKSTIKAAETRQRLYTDKEKFNYLAEKQPLLLKLKEKLSLDTDF